MIFYRCGVFQLRFLGNADELLDVIPLAFEQRSVIRYGVIGGVHRRDARHDGELPNLRFLGEFVLQISPRRSRVEQVNHLNVLARGYALSPVGVKYGGYFARSVSRGKAAVTGFLSQKSHNFCAVFVENKH